MSWLIERFEGCKRLQFSQALSRARILADVELTRPWPGVSGAVLSWWDPDLGHLRHSGKSPLPSLGRHSLLFPCWAPGDPHKTSLKLCFQKGLKGKFPEIPAPFPASWPKSADFGQSLQNAGLQLKKFAAKFSAAGNFHVVIDPTCGRQPSA